MGLFVNEKNINFLRKYPRIFEVSKKAYMKYYVGIRRAKKIPKRIWFEISGKKDIVERLLLDYPLIYSEMMTEKQMEVILRNLQQVLENDVPGEIVELGCNVGTTSMFIRKMLDHYNSKKVLHVYDSFEGLPEKRVEDKKTEKQHFKEGSCKTSREVLVENFRREKLKIPEIHEGWFKKIPLKEYPKAVSFAFFDGDFYSSIVDSFERVYPRMTKDSRILVHDYQYDALPGVEKACEDYLKDKPEKGKVKNEENIGVIRKE